MVYDSSQAETSLSAVGCTKTCESIRGSPSGYPDIDLRLVDTVGLDESLEGTVPSKEAMSMLEKKLNALYSGDGVHLILFCIKKGRLSEKTNKHYQIIVRDLSENQIPCLFVITRCEDEEPILGTWWERNKDDIQNRLKYEVKDAVAVTTIKSESTMDDYNTSREHLIEAIRKYALKEPWRSQSFQEKLRATLMSKGIGFTRIPQAPADSIQDRLQQPMQPQGRLRTMFTTFFRH